MMTYPASYARMRGLKGRLLGKDQLEAFLQASDAQAIISVLNHTVYGEQLRDSMSPSQIEHALKQDLVASYIKILTFLRGKPAHFVKALLEGFELLNVKSVIRALVQESPHAKDALAPFIFSLGKHHTVPIKRILGAADLKSCVGLMRKTPFARSLEIGYHQYESEKRLFLFELVLDMGYYERLWRALNDLSSMDKYNASELMGLQYDMINLIWMLRFKEYYKLPPEQMFQYILPHGWKINKDVFWEIAAESDITGAIVARRMNPYYRLLRSVTQVDDNHILGVEVSLLRYLYNRSRKALLGFPLQAAPLVAFFVLKEMEVRDIITILAGKRLGLPQERIRSYLVTL